jgi:RNA polymerase sporulation-specific sigma factor
MCRFIFYFVFQEVVILNNDINSLLDDVKNGKPLSFDAVYSLYLPLIQSATVKLMKAYGISSSEEDDISQEAALALYKAALAFDTATGVSFGHYAKICIQNRIISYIRSNKSRGEASDIPYEFYCDTPAGSTPEELFISAEAISELNEKISSSLTEFEAAVFRLYLEDLSYEDISHAIGRPKKSVDNAISRIKAKLRKLL